MYEYDEYNPKKKDEYEETEQESIANSADGMKDEPHVDGESIEMEAEVISGEEYAEEISGEQFSEEEDFSEQESVSEANTEEGAEKAEAFAEASEEGEPEYTGPCVREYHYEEKVKAGRKRLEEIHCSLSGLQHRRRLCDWGQLQCGTESFRKGNRHKDRIHKQYGKCILSDKRAFHCGYREEGKALCCQRFHYHNRRDTVYGAFHRTIRSRGRRQRCDLLFG